MSWLSNKAAEFENKQHVLRDVYGWWKSVDLLAPVKALAKAIPVIGPKVAEMIAQYADFHLRD